MTSRCPYLVTTGSSTQAMRATQACSYRCALYAPERIGGAYLAAVCLAADYRSCLRLARSPVEELSPVGAPSSASRHPPKGVVAEVVALAEAPALPAPTPPETVLKEPAPPEPPRPCTAPTILPPSSKQVARRPSNLFTVTEVAVLSLGMAGMVALLLVAVGIAFRVAEEPALFAVPLSKTTNKIAVLVEERFATPTSAPPALAAASALRISLKAHEASSSVPLAQATPTEPQLSSAEASSTNPQATATTVAASQTPAVATQVPMVSPTAETLPAPAPLEPTPTPSLPPATQIPAPSRDIAAASEPAVPPTAGHLPPTRIVIPRIGLDVPVRPVGTISYEVDGETRYIWDTLPDTAAFHDTSAFPGLPGNTVINGHRDIEAAVFRALGEVRVGDAIHVFVSEAVGYIYEVVEILVVPQVDASPEQLAANRRLLGYYPEVRLTLVTCEPLGSATHRLVIIAKPPVAQPQAAAPQGSLQLTGNSP